MDFMDSPTWVSFHGIVPTNQKIFNHILDVAMSSLPSRYVTKPETVRVTQDAHLYALMHRPGLAPDELKQLASGMTVTWNHRTFAVWLCSENAYSTMAHEIVHILIMPARKYAKNPHGFMFRRCLRKLHKALNWDKPTLYG